MTWVKRRDLPSGSNTDAPKLQMKEVVTVRKYDGDYVEGMEPVETITVETVSDPETGEIISQEVTKE